MAVAVAWLRAGRRGANEDRVHEQRRREKEAPRGATFSDSGGGRVSRKKKHRSPAGGARGRGPGSEHRPASVSVPKRRPRKNWDRNEAEMKLRASRGKVVSVVRGRPAEGHPHEVGGDEGDSDYAEDSFEEYDEASPGIAAPKGAVAGAISSKKEGGGDDGRLLLDVMQTAASHPNDMASLRQESTATAPAPPVPRCRRCCKCDSLKPLRRALSPWRR